VTLPNLSSLKWKTADSLPEITSQYSDESWTVANRTITVNPLGVEVTANLSASLYGYHTGNVLWRGHFNASGSETGITLDVWGGLAFGYSIWLDSDFLGSWEGDAFHSTFEGTFDFPRVLVAGSSHAITVLQDYMGLEENWASAGEQFKTPRGIVNFEFLGTNTTEVSVWKVTENLGGKGVCFPK
ncbi:hypothetical protein K435DRAFT_700214, partial [Dendrothele bispora CBS 962.96]